MKFCVFPDLVTVFFKNSVVGSQLSSRWELDLKIPAPHSPSWVIWVMCVEKWSLVFFRDQMHTYAFFKTRVAATNIMYIFFVSYFKERAVLSSQSSNSTSPVVWLSLKYPVANHSLPCASTPHWYIPKWLLGRSWCFIKPAGDTGWPGQPGKVSQLLPEPCHCHPYATGGPSCHPTQQPGLGWLCPSSSPGLAGRAVGALVVLSEVPPSPHPVLSQQCLLQPQQASPFSDSASE